MRKAFTDLNLYKTGNISPEELRYQLNFWGLEISDDQFNKVFSKFDQDKDGKISYKDFQLSIGADMFPAEGLYFRQDFGKQDKINTCNHYQCFQATKNNLNFCDIHQKMHQDESI